MSVQQDMDDLNAILMAVEVFISARFPEMTDITRHKVLPTIISYEVADVLQKLSSFFEAVTKAEEIVRKSKGA
jgi:hypothetical protein